MNKRVSRCALVLAGGLVAAGALSGCGSSVDTADVGTCTNWSDLQAGFTDFPDVDCGDGHDAQVFYKFDLDDGDYPGDDAVQTEAQSQCGEQFEGYVGTAYEDSALDFAYVPPDETTWNEADDREVLCVLVSQDDVTESFENSGL